MGEFGEVERAFYVDDTTDMFSIEEINEDMHKQDVIIVKFKEVMGALLAKKKMDE